MNKIETLIQELCPNGVEKKELSQISRLTRGKVMSKQFLEENSGDFPVYSSQTRNRGEIGKISTYDFDGEYITWTTDGANAGTVFYRNGKFSITNVCGLIDITDNNLSIKYLYYILSISTKKYVSSGMGNPKLMSNVVGKIKIPIPPLEIQEEIVKILDKFTDYVTELTTELTLRQKQFEKYKEVLIGFEDKDIKLVKLLEIAEYGKKRIDNSEIEEGNYIGVENLLKNKEGIELKKIKLPSGTSIAFFPENILIGNIRPYLKKIYYSDFVGGTNGDVLVIQINEEKKHEVNPRFLYYCLSTDYFFHYMNQNSKGAKMPRGDKSKVMLFEIPLPSINKQSEIVAILDKFYNLTYNVSSGLPKEIELRKKQYEYYRDKLLSFD